MFFFNGNDKTILRICGFILLFCCFKLLIACTVCSSFLRIFIDARFELPERVQVYYGLRARYSEARSKKTAAFPAGERTMGTTDINNHVARHLRIDLGEHPGTTRLYSLRLTSFFFPDAKFSPKGIMERFGPGPGVTMSLAGEGGDRHVVVTSATDDPYIVLTEPLRHRGFFLSWLFPLAATSCVAILLSGTSLRAFPAFADMAGEKRSAAAPHFAALDGLRGLAALAVLAEHAGIMSNAVGGVGVLLFFALSGFLLALPFLRDPTRAVSGDYMLTYMRRRLLRIIPMYYTVVTALYLFGHKMPDVFRHYLFLQGDAYLWTVPQEMFFYLLLPPLALVLYGLDRVEARAAAGRIPVGVLVPTALLAAVLAGTWMARHQVVTLYGNGAARPALIGVFLSGIFFASLFQTLRARPFWTENEGERLRRGLGIAGTAGALLLLLAARRPAGFEIYDNTGAVGFLAAFFIFCVACAPGSLPAKCMNSVILRAVGVVGFSFYLLHPTALTFCRETARYFFDVELGAPTRFLAAALTAYCASACTYSWIERPFMKHRNAARRAG